MGIVGPGPKEGSLLKPWFQALVESAVLVPEPKEKLYQDAQAVVTWMCRNWPMKVWLPPVSGVSGRPGDAIVTGLRSTGDAVVLRCQEREIRGVDHGAR